MDERYRSLDSFWQFDEDRNVPGNLRQLIRPLAVAYSASLWTQWVSPTKNHLMQMRDSADSLIDWGEWVADYTADWYEDDTARIPPLLRSLMPWQPGTIIYFFESKHWGFETTWETFLGCWWSFLYDDEGSILLSEASADILVFRLRNLWA